MRILVLGDSYIAQGGMNQATGEGSDSWIPTTPGAANAPVAGVVTGNGFLGGGTQSSEWGNLSPDNNNGMLPEIFRGLLAAGITTELNVCYAESGGAWSDQEGKVDDLVIEDPTLEFGGIILAAGINTAAGAQTRAQYEPQLQSIVAKLITTYAPKFILLVSSCTLNNNTVSFPSLTYEPRVDEVNQTMKDLAAKNPMVFYSDTFNAMGGHTIDANLWIPSPNIHPNSNGSGNRIAPQIVTDFILANSAGKTMTFGRDGTGVNPPASLTASLTANGNRKSFTTDSNLSAGTTHLGVGNEKIPSGKALLRNTLLVDAEVKLSLYLTADDVGVRNSPEGQVRLGAVSELRTVPASTDWIEYEFTFPTPFEPVAGQVIIGAVTLTDTAGTGVGVGSAGTTAVFAYFTPDDAPAIWFDSSNSNAAIQDPYIWFETELKSSESIQSLWDKYLTFKGFPMVGDSITGRQMKWLRSELGL